MKNKVLLLSAAMVTIGLVALAWSLSRVATEIAAARQESAEFKVYLDNLSQDVPRMAEEAGDEAGRSAVNGAVDEAVFKPLRRLASMVSPDRDRDRPQTSAETRDEPSKAGVATTPTSAPPVDGRTTAPEEASRESIPAIIHIEFIEPSVSVEVNSDFDPSSLLPKRTPDPDPGRQKRCPSRRGPGWPISATEA